MPSMMLSAVKTGITRLRVKGGASADSLYDLVNGYVTAARTISPRPGSQRFAQLPDGTIGLSLFNGVFQVFSDHVVGYTPPGFNVNVLSPPSDLGEFETASLVRIWKAEPLMGGLYVVAEWSDRVDRGIHYWLGGASTGSWKPNAIYMLGETITASNGLSFYAGRIGEPAETWSADKEVAEGDIVEPTKFNGYRYIADEVHGSARTGKTEPAWIAQEGATTIEDADTAPPAGSGGSGGSGGSSGGSGGGGGYSNPGGSCVTHTSIMSDGAPALLSVVGLGYATHDPSEGFATTPLKAKGNPILQPCVRMHTRLGGSIRCSVSTPFTHVDALMDSPESAILAPDMLGQKVRALHGGERIIDTIVRIDDIGYQLVVPLDFGGRSFAAGDDPDFLIFSHNVRKAIESPTEVAQ